MASLIPGDSSPSAASSMTATSCSPLNLQLQDPCTASLDCAESTLPGARMSWRRTYAIWGAKAAGLGILVGMICFVVSEPRPLVQNARSFVSGAAVHKTQQSRERFSQVQAIATHVAPIEQSSPSKTQGFRGLIQRTRPAAPVQQKLKVIVSVDWEGQHLERENLEAMQKFRKDFPDVPMLHFMCPEYFLKPDVDNTEVKRLIDSVLLPSDELGLHLHGWKTTIDAAGVKFREGPRWSTVPGDEGYDVPMASYSVDELRQVLKFSKKTLSEHGYGNPVSFRAGGWCASDETLQALILEGFTMDSSNVPIEYVGKDPALQKIVGRCKTARTSCTSQPCVFEYNGRELVEVPNNGALADWVNEATMLDAFKKNVRLWQQNPSKEVVLTIGFHQETAALYMERLRDAIRFIQWHGEDHDVPIEFVTAESLEVWSQEDAETRQQGQQVSQEDAEEGSKAEHYGSSILALPGAVKQIHVEWKGQAMSGSESPSQEAYMV